MPALHAQRENAIGWIVFSNPGKRNAVNYEMLVALPEALARLQRDPAVRVIALAGEGDEDFVSGADRTEFGAIRGSQFAADSYGQAVDAVYDAFAAAAKPVLAKVRGACGGVGLSLALSCDLRMVADDASFSHPATRYGIGVSWGSVRNLASRVGVSNAAEILFTARTYDAGEALRLGIATRVVPAAQLDAAFQAYCDEIAAGAPLSLAAARRALVEFLADPQSRDLRTVKALVDACNASDDYKEGLAALLGGRAANFRGR
jgi:enoyl-CoA hydratase/carnithine racemase